MFLQSLFASNHLPKNLYTLVISKILGKIAENKGEIKISRYGADKGQRDEE